MIVPCTVCQIPLSRTAREKCPSPACPCYGTVVGSEEMRMRAEQWRSRKSVAQSRAMDGRAALEQLDGQCADPVEQRALSRMREAERLREGHTTVSDALRWLIEHRHPVQEWPS